MMEKNLTDIEKTKIDILRDALKDASDTIRALDRKINFIVSYNAVFLGIISTLFFKYKEFSLIQYSCIFYTLLTILGLIWIVVFIKMMISIAPKLNPVEVFRTKEDQLFSNNHFFIFTQGKTNTLNLTELTTNYSNIDTYSNIEKLLYKEIGKVSYIRDLKSNKINKSVTYSWILTVVFIILVGLFGLSTSINNQESPISSSADSKEIVINSDNNSKIEIKKEMDSHGSK